MKKNPLPRLDQRPELVEVLRRYCRLSPGEIWQDPAGKHRVGCLDAAEAEDVRKLLDDEVATLAIHDPPYNLVAFETRALDEYIAWCRRWIDNTFQVLADDAALYVWLGADQRDGFQPLPDFMVMMRSTPFTPRSFVTMRNQRGYGTQHNWMAVRQELLYYTKGKAHFDVEAEYTEIPKILRGYYKSVGGQTTENLERGKSDCIRAGNVWVDIQQVFYRMQENVNGCFAQKPLKAIDRIIRASSRADDLVLDFFGHSGTTLLAAEIVDRRCCTMELDPVFCEIAIRRLEHFRATGLTGWQNSHAFESEQRADSELREMLGELTAEERTLFPA